MIICVHISKVSKLSDKITYYNTNRRLKKLNIQFFIIKSKNKMGSYLPKPVTQKKFHSQTYGKLKYTVCQMQGWRRQMEDAYISDISLGDGNSLFAVFDGHAGNQVSHYVKEVFVDMLLKNIYYIKGDYEKAMIEVFESVDVLLRSDQGQSNLIRIRKQKPHIKVKQTPIRRIGDTTGCTANVVLVTPLVYVVANCGDSRSILSKKGKATQLSFDHKPDLPTQFSRIYNSGSVIVEGRVNGVLNLSRGFGDFKHKQKHLKYEQTAITCYPDVKIFPRSPQDQFILIGCDGIFERFQIDNQPLIKFIRKEMKAKKKGEQILSKLFDHLLAKDIHETYGCDNMTAILIQI